MCKINENPESFLAEGILLGRTFKKEELLPLLNNESSYRVLKTCKETLTNDEKFLLLKKISRGHQLTECIKFLPYEMLKENICISVEKYASAKLYDDLYLAYMLEYPQDIKEMQSMFFYILKYNTPTMIAPFFKKKYFNLLDDRNKQLLVDRTCQSIYYFGLNKVTEITPEGYEMLIRKIKEGNNPVESILSCPAIKDKLPLLQKCPVLQYRNLDVFFSSHTSKRIINKISTNVLKDVLLKFQEHYSEKFYANYKEICDIIDREELKELIQSLVLLKEVGES